MPADGFWENSRAINILASLAQQNGIQFRLRGSAAAVVSDALRQNRFRGLLESLAPFTDLDFLVDDDATGRVLASELGRRLPASRFFRVDIVTLQKLEHYRNSNLIIENLPMIAFGSAESVEHEVVFRTDSDGRLMPADAALIGQPTVRRGEGDLDIGNALIDIAYVARRHPMLLYSNPLDELRSALRKRPEEAVREIRGPRKRRFLFALVKLLLARTVSVPAIREWFDDPVWDELEMSHPSARVRHLVELVRYPPADVIVVTVPRRKGSAWPSNVDHVTGSTGSTTPILFGSKEETFTLNVRIPPVAIVTDEPERPGCCLYRDFSRGVVEVGWTGIEPADNGGTTLVGNSDDFFLAPSLHSSNGEQHSAKIDYGFLCQLAGESRAIDIHPAGADDAF